VPRRQQRRPVGKKRAPKTSQEDTRARVGEFQRLSEEADHVPFQEPSPNALRKYRRTTREPAQAQRAFAMATGR
jgi:hypothetical protein